MNIGELTCRTLFWAAMRLLDLEAAIDEWRLRRIALRGADDDETEAA